MPQLNLGLSCCRELTCATLMDDEDAATKETVLYISTHRDYLVKYTERVERVSREIADELISDLSIEMLNKKDYYMQFDSETGRIVSLESYIKKMITICKKRYFSNKSKRSSHESSCYTMSSSREGEMESIFDNLISSDIDSDGIEGVEYDLELAINNCRSMRYIYEDIDIFSILYAYVVANDIKKFKYYMRTLAITESEGLRLKELLRINEDFIYLMKALERSESGEEELRKCVYCSKMIRSALA